MTRTANTDEKLRKTIAYLNGQEAIDDEMKKTLRSYLIELLDKRKDRKDTFIPLGNPGDDESYQERIEYFDTDDVSVLGENLEAKTVFYRFRPVTKNNLFVDMDGTLAHWRSPGEEYTLCGHTRYFHSDDIKEKGYFKELPPNEMVVSAIKNMIKDDNGLDVYILSSVLPVCENPAAFYEKQYWLKKYLPEIPSDRYVFIPNGRSKIDFLNLELTDCNILLDDYTKNLQQFTMGKVKNVGVKILTGINDTHGSWLGDRADGLSSPERIVDDIMNAFIKHVSRFNSNR